MKFFNNLYHIPMQSLNRLLLILFASILLYVTPGLAQTDEQVLREIISREDEHPPKKTEDFIFSSGRTPRPVVGLKQFETMTKSLENQAQAASGLPKRTTKTEMKRLVVAQSGDLAYDFGDVVFTDKTADGKVTSLNSSYLRTWRKINGEWMVDAVFFRRNEPESHPVTNR